MPAEYKIELAEAELRGYRRGVLACALYASECGVEILDEGYVEAAQALGSIAQVLKEWVESDLSREGGGK